jgi:hypothetical protein
MLHGYADSDWAGSPVDKKVPRILLQFRINHDLLVQLESRDLLLRAQPRLNILRLAMPTEKQCGSENLFLGYLVKSLRLRLSIVIIRAV